MTTPTPFALAFQATNTRRSLRGRARGGPTGRAPGLRPLEPSIAGGTRDASEKEILSPRGHAGFRNRRREGGNVHPLSSLLQAVEPVQGPLPGTSRPGLGPEDLVLRPPVAKARGTDNIHQVATSQPSLVNRRRRRVHSTAPGVEVRAGSRDAPAPRGAGGSRARRAAAFSACHRSIGVAITRNISIYHPPVPALPPSPRDGHRGPGRGTPVRQSDRQQRRATSSRLIRGAGEQGTVGTPATGGGSREPASRDFDVRDRPPPSAVSWKRRSHSSRVAIAEQGSPRES